MLDMLTNQFNLMSKPGQPQFVNAKVQKLYQTCIFLKKNVKNIT